MTSLRIPILALSSALAALGHYTWLAPDAALTPGKPATIRISHGHKFPTSEEAINARQVDLFVVAPSGKRTKLTATSAGTAVTAPFTPTEAGPHRLAFTQDRGVSSRTPQGVKPGGRDKNPTATQASRTFRTAVAYLAANASSQPLGLELELTAKFASGAFTITLLKNGKPAAGIPIELFLPGAAQATELAKTDASGQVRYQPPASAKGPALFSAGFKDQPPAGAPYDTTNYETSLYVTW